MVNKLEMIVEVVLERELNVLPARMFQITTWRRCSLRSVSRPDFGVTTSDTLKSSVVMVLVIVVSVGRSKTASTTTAVEREVVNEQSFSFSSVPAMPKVTVKSLSQCIDGTMESSKMRL
eukprot:TRINITY_DN11893_c0_g1::TRINITY_DN11893_c0_g1_i1::g.16433::m.16433 TRINITY_DN11893_c0_g1::TRINITY_DN11893_c0_g1_i1::g.16433  ORF type:complete len:119 (-),score=-11.85,DUF3255/PF11631.3/0.13 TRINITY_DN11893_c0_g1_i1:686-1042(-)